MRFARTNRKKSSGVSPNASEIKKDEETLLEHQNSIEPPLPTLFGKPFNVFQLAFYYFGLATLLTNAAIVTDLGYFINEVSILL